jgi:hypothetical protein
MRDGKSLWALTPGQSMPKEGAACLFTARGLVRVELAGVCSCWLRYDRLVPRGWALKSWRKPYHRIGVPQAWRPNIFPWTQSHDLPETIQAFRAICIGKSVEAGTPLEEYLLLPPTCPEECSSYLLQIIAPSLTRRMVRFHCSVCSPGPFPAFV